jgi:HK97 family phage major capsid protein
MPDIAAGAIPVAFGYWNAGYLISDQIGIRVLRDPYTAKPYVHFYTTKRVGGGPLDTNAIKLLKIGTSA